MGLCKDCWYWEPCDEPVRKGFGDCRKIQAVDSLPRDALACSLYEDGCFACKADFGCVLFEEK